MFGQRLGQLFAFATPFAQTIAVTASRKESVAPNGHVGKVKCEGRTRLSGASIHQLVLQSLKDQSRCLFAVFPLVAHVARHHLCAFLKVGCQGAQPLRRIWTSISRSQHHPFAAGGAHTERDGQLPIGDAARGRWYGAMAKAGIMLLKGL